MASASASPATLAPPSPANGATRPPRSGGRPRGSTLFDKDIEFLFKRTGITRGMIRSLPPFQENPPSIYELPDSQRRALLRVFTKCVREIATMLYPSDSEALFKELSEKKCEKIHVGKALVHGMQSARKGSIERRIMRACLCASYPGQEVQRLLNEANIKKCNSAAEDDNEHDNEYEDDDVVGNSSDPPGDDDVGLGSNQSEQINQIGTGSNVGNGGNGSDNIDAQNLNSDNPKEPPSKRLKLSGGFRRTYSVGRSDWNTLIAKGSLPGLTSRGSKRSVARGDDEMIQHALQFIFRSENLHLIPSGAYRLKCNGEFKDFPFLYRRLYQDVEQLWKNYISEIQTTNPQQRHYGRTVFLGFVKNFTHGQVRKRGSADYIPEFLLDKNFRLIERVVEKEVTDVSVAKLLLEKTRAVEDYLRFTYSTHIDGLDCPDDPIHSTDFALLCHNVSTSAEPKSSNCRECLRPFQLLTDIQRSITNTRQDIIHVICDAREKLLLYMGHKQRGAVQDKRVAALFHQLQQAEEGTSAVIMTNFNMRFEGIRYKHGVMAHGSAIFYRDANNTTSPSSRQPRTSFRQNDVGCELSTMFIDHVPGNDTVQDAEAVLQVIDALMARLKLELPNVNRVWIVSDDAKHYQNELTPVLLPFIAHHHGLHLHGLIHSETVLGRCLGEAHFSIATRLVRKYCIDKKRDIAVPTDLMNALSYSDGVYNSCVELLNIFRDGANLKPWLKARQTRKLAKLFRITEIEYGAVSGDKVVACCYKICGGVGRRFEFGRHYSKEIANQVDNASGAGETGHGFNQVDTNNQSAFGMNDSSPTGGNNISLQAHHQPPGLPVLPVLPVLPMDLAATPDVPVAPGMTMLPTTPEAPLESTTSEGPAESTTAAASGEFSAAAQSTTSAAQADFVAPVRPTELTTVAASAEFSIPGEERAEAVMSAAVDNTTNRRREMKFRGHETDVIVWMRSKVVRRAVSGRIVVETAVDDAVAAIEREKESYDEMEDGDGDEDDHGRCSKCGQTGSISPGSGCDSGDRTVLNRASMIAMNMLKTKEVVIFDRKTQNPSLAQVMVEPETVGLNRLQAGWARRIQNGLTHGRNFVSAYASDITELHNHGLQTCGKGTSAKVIQEGLQKRYPQRYDIPSEYHINVMIASIRKSLNANLPAGSTGPGGPGRARKMPLHYAEGIREMVLNDRSIMPRDGRAQLIELLDLNADLLPEDFPDDHSIRCTMSSLKTVLNKQ